jgi:1-pyrroline-5-carboxylate dehydrogenase
MSSLANFKVPSVSNEPNKHYAKGSADRDGLAAAISAFAKKAPLEIPLVIGGKSVGRPYFIASPVLS